ncbi:MAG: exodeoxyribonuclease VII large subunit [Chlamydiota bacterium]
METLSVSALTSFIKKNLEKDFCWLKVQGEVSNAKDSSGHLYFTLKDDSDAGKAQISCVFFKKDRIKSGQTFENGDLIVVEGSLSVYPPRGSYQIIIRSFSTAGLGTLLLRLHQTKERLQKEGLFDEKHKQPLPLFPKTIGVITSPTGAVIQDILHVLRRRYPGFHLILFPVKVQGEGSSEEIALAIKECDRYELCDLLIVGRGGGSLEDLWAFNEERVVRAVFEAKNIPIVSAVGHETDHTLIDLVADKRAPTPSAAAELAVREKASLQQALEERKKQMAYCLQKQVEEKRQRLNVLSKLPHFSDPTYFLAKWSQELDEKRSELCVGVQKKLEETKRSFAYLQKGYQEKDPTLLIQERRKSLARCKEHLAAIDPKLLVKRGYTILFSKNTGEVIVSADQLRTSDEITATLKDGAIEAQVKRVTKGTTP